MARRRSCVKTYSQNFFYFESDNDDNSSIEGLSSDEEEHIDNMLKGLSDDEDIVVPVTINEEDIPIVVVHKSQSLEHQTGASKKKKRKISVSTTDDAVADDPPSTSSTDTPPTVFTNLPTVNQQTPPTNTPTNNSTIKSYDSPDNNTNPIPPFMPVRPAGPHIISTGRPLLRQSFKCALDFFCLYFTNELLETIVVVTMLSTIDSANEYVNVKRKVKVDDKWDKVDVRKPYVVDRYNAYMNAVDRSDQLLAKYNLLRKSVK